MKFWRNEELEQLAETRLAEFEQVRGEATAPPVPIDVLAEQLFDLRFLWEEIEELPGETVWGGIRPRERQIVLNERHKDTFLEKPGLERSTKGHEIGHWDVFVDKATLDHPVLFDGEKGGTFALRSGAKGAIVVLLRSEAGQDLLRQIRARADEPDEARVVNRYAAALSMPRDLIRREVSRVDRTLWPNLYRIAETFDVTISALVVRLKQLNLLSMSDDGRTLFESREQAQGQGRLFR